MHILSWNIQAGRGPDNVNSLERIALAIAECRFPDGSDADVICLQEVTRGFPSLTNGLEVDQAAELQQLFPDYHAIYRPALDIASGAEFTLPRWQFGCLILSRYPIVQVFNHLLTQRGLSGKGMQRQALEVIIGAPAQTFRIMTTHLEFHAQECRANQVEQLRALQDEVASKTIPSLPEYASYGSPYAAPARPHALILCGDLNLLVESPEYERLVCATDVSAGLVDAWRHLRPEETHVATCGWADPVQWPEGPHCRDYFFVSHQLSQQLAWTGVDVDVRASDHQPILLMLDTPPNQ